VEDDDDDVMMVTLQTVERSDENGGLQNPRRILAIITVPSILCGLLITCRLRAAGAHSFHDLRRQRCGSIVEGAAVCNSLIIEEVRGSM
jgi:hypothetical protein